MKFKRKARTLCRLVGHRLEVLPNGLLDRCDVYGSPDVPDRPQWLLCDCCLQECDRLWLYPHRGFCLRYGRQRLEYTESNWGFCVFCRALMGSPDLLVARVATLTDLEPDRLETMYDIVLRCIDGEPVLWESGRMRVRTKARNGNAGS